jgi:hypothetical protein
MLFGRMQTAAEIPLHTNGAECDIRRLPLETVDEILPGASGEGFTLLPGDLLWLASGVNAMTIVIEISSRTGTRAYKEYDAPSVDATIKEANRELRPYPEFWVTASRLMGGERCRENQMKKAWPQRSVKWTSAPSHLLGGLHSVGFA